MAKNNKITDPEVLEKMELFRWAYDHSVEPLTRLQELQATYDNIVNPSSWATISKIPIPVMFTMVEQTLPSLMEYLFPKSNFIRLTPMSAEVTVDQAVKAEMALEHTVRRRMRLQNTSLETLKDCIKLGVGFGIVEPYRQSVPKEVVKSVTLGNRIVASDTSLSAGSYNTVRFRHISPGQIIVTPDGSRFNGSKRVSTAFFVDIYTESEFRRMMLEEVPADSEIADVKGDVEAIIEDAREQGYMSRINTSEIIATLGGVDLKLDAKKLKKTPVKIPVVKCYSDNEHMWIANGNKVIYRASEKYETMRCPLVKACAWPDGDRFYPMNPAEASHSLALGTNVWMNALVDLFSGYLNPTMIYDKMKTENGEPPKRGPHSDIGVTGSIKEAAGYVNQPTAPNGVFEIGGMFDSWFGRVVGKDPNINQASPGLVRGGVNAFESLLQNSTAREKLMSAILETDWLEDVVLQTLVYMQLNVDDDGDMLVTREWSPADRKEVVRSSVITKSDLIHAYEVDLSLEEKYMTSAAQTQAKMGEFSVLKDDPYVNQYELRRDLLGADSRSARLLVAREEAAELESNLRDAKVQQEQAAAQEAQAQSAPTTAEQGLIGALTPQEG